MLDLIRKALETHLAAIASPLATAWENVSFVPVNGTPYQRVNLLPATPEDSSLASGLHFERGIFQVTLCYPTGTGPSAAQAKAKALQAHFKRGTTLVEAPIQVLIPLTPAIGSGFKDPDEDRYCIPVSIRWQCQVTH